MPMDYITLERVVRVGTDTADYERAFAELIAGTLARKLLTPDKMLRVYVEREIRPRGTEEVVLEVRLYVAEEIEKQKQVAQVHAENAMLRDVLGSVLGTLAKHCAQFQLNKSTGSGITGITEIFEREFGTMLKPKAKG